MQRKEKLEKMFCSTGDAAIITRLNGESLKIIDESLMYAYPEKDVQADGLYLKLPFEKDFDVKKFIQQNDIKDIVKVAVTSINKNEYILNIHSVENWAALPPEGESWMAKRQIDIYLPIIKYFLLYGFQDLL